ncbi:hypothetical protein H5410_053785 [Solanum commersonii]|uniref:Uncharacterized protein n=1 Tax=Solanum commersonii TaxID=4109 RepID=A0A9J5X7C7_SOLCO|nr:hypothetical protein H5410_053785 [Solanum commersonii]
MVKCCPDHVILLAVTNAWTLLTHLVIFYCRAFSSPVLFQLLRVDRKILQIPVLLRKAAQTLYGDPLIRLQILSRGCGFVTRICRFIHFEFEAPPNPPYAAWKSAGVIEITCRDYNTAFIVSFRYKRFKYFIISSEGGCGRIDNDGWAMHSGDDWGSDEQ